MVGTACISVVLTDLTCFTFHKGIGHIVNPSLRYKIIRIFVVVKLWDRTKTIQKFSVSENIYCSIS